MECHVRGERYRCWGVDGQLDCEDWISRGDRPRDTGRSQTPPEPFLEHWQSHGAFSLTPHHCRDPSLTFLPRLSPKKILHSGRFLLTSRSSTPTSLSSTFSCRRGSSFCLSHTAFTSSTRRHREPVRRFPLPRPCPCLPTPPPQSASATLHLISQNLPSKPSSPNGPSPSPTGEASISLSSVALSRASGSLVCLSLEYGTASDSFKT